MTYRARCEGRRQRRKALKLARDRRAYTRWRLDYDAFLALKLPMQQRMTGIINYEMFGPMNQRFRTWEEKRRGVPPPPPSARWAHYHVPLLESVTWKPYSTAYSIPESP